MGFEPQIRHIVDGLSLPPKSARQTLMFSATFPRDIQSLARHFLRTFSFLTVGRVGAASANVTQEILFLTESDKLNRLQEALKRWSGQLVLVFVMTKRNADVLENRLRQGGVKVAAIHGDLRQWEREMALGNFRTQKSTADEEKGENAKEMM